MIQNINATPQLLAKQHNIIKRIAQRGDCVIVGRGADVILSEYSPLRIFVHADVGSRLERCRVRAKDGEDIGTKELLRKIKSIDKARKESYAFLSDKTWGDKSAYDICINTTDMEIKSIVPSIAALASTWFEGKENGN